MEVRELVVTGVAEMRAGNLALVAIRRADAVGQGINDPIGLGGELGVIEDHRRHTAEGTPGGRTLEKTLGGPPGPRRLPGGPPAPPPALREKGGDGRPNRPEGV